VIWVALALFALTVVVAALACYRIETTADRMIAAVRDNHALCVTSIHAAASTEHAADVLESAASAWGSVEEEGHRKWLATRNQNSPHSMPVIWLRDRAETLRRGESLTEHWSKRKGPWR
jgi:hypothetical protein